MALLLCVCFVDGLWSVCNILKYICMVNVRTGVVFTTTGKDSDGCLGNSAVFTSVEDVDIELANVSDAVGIQIGGTQIVNSPTSSNNDLDITVQLGVNDYCPVFVDPYSSHFRVRVRLGSSGGCGLRVVNGFLHFAQAHLTVFGHVNGSGVGIDLQSAHSKKAAIRQAISSKYTYPPVDIFDGFVFYSQFSQIVSTTLVSPGGFMLVTSNVPSQNRLLRDPAYITKLDIQVKSIT